VETTAATTSPVGLGVAMVASEGVPGSALPVDPPVALEAAQMEEDPVRGSLGVVATVQRTRRESPPAPLLGGSHSPVRGEPPLQWMAAQDPMSALFTLDDHAESMERESLDIGLSTMMNALDQARGVLREIFVPTSQVSIRSPLFSSFFKCFCVFVFLNSGLLSRSLLLVVGTNPSSSTSRRWNGIASPRRPSCEEMWARSLLPPSSGRPRHVGTRRRPTRFEDLSARVKLDEEEAAKIKKEWHELVQKDVEASK